MYFYISYLCLLLCNLNKKFIFKHKIEQQKLQTENTLIPELLYIRNILNNNLTMTLDFLCRKCLLQYKLTILSGGCFLKYLF